MTSVVFWSLVVMGWPYNSTIVEYIVLTYLLAGG